MFALLTLAAVLASAPAGPSAVGAGQSPLDLYLARERDWQKSNLDTTGWSLVTQGADIMIFLRPAPHAATGNPMVAVRGEHYPFAHTNPIGSGESFLSRDEIDCTKKLERTISSTIYSDNGLKGDIVSASDDPGAWKAIKDGTFVAAAETQFCTNPPPAAPSR